MNKNAQIAVNAEVKAALALLNHRKEEVIKSKRLRFCHARVDETKSYYILVSYNTAVAFIDKETDTLYDILRLVYGYTSTSAQHIAKFSHDYGAGKFECAYRYTYRQV